MRAPFALKLAWREARSSVRRLGVYMLAITLGVAALVAINSFRAGVVDSVTAEAKRLMGADLAVSSGRPFPDSVRALLDSLEHAGARVADVTSTVSVALAPRGATRLIQLRAVEPGYPYYTTYATDPPGLWATLAGGRAALVEPPLLVALDAAVGDTLRIGEAAFRIAGVLTDLPADLAMSSAIGPRVFIADRWLAETGLVRFGSLITYRAYAALPAGGGEALVDRYRDFFRDALVRVETAEEQAQDLAQALDALGRFLGLVGLAALLLGGLGVASAVGVFVREKRPVIAVLRCIGATRRTAFTAYLLQAALLGLAGAAAGALLGIGIQAALPSILRGVFPVEAAFAIRPVPILVGLAIGVVVATLFALLPLLEVRGISPLQALRYDVEESVRSGSSVEASPTSERIGARARSRGRSRVWASLGGAVRDRARLAAWLVLVLGVFAVAAVQAGDAATGLAFAGGIAGAVLLLYLAAVGLTRAARRWLPRRASFVVRQGIAGLYRPRNQTAAVTVALGFGVFLVASLWLVQRSLLGWLAVEETEREPNLVAFDIQQDQRADVERILAQHGEQDAELVPLVTARIAALDGVPVAEVLDSPRVRDVEPWAVRREYRNTYRAAMTSTEELVAGEWWDEPRAEGTLPRISMEDDLARSLDLEVGDRVTWNLQGIEIETVIASLRTVDWGRVDTNFFVVFEPGVIDAAPQTYVTLAYVEDAAARSAAQRDLTRAHANIATLDVALVRETLAGIVRRVTTAIRFMAGFGVAAGLIVLAGAVAASRFQRVRESALLRTLGATRAQVRRILLTEYLALGALAAVAGTTFAVAASWAVVRFFFELEFVLPILALAGGAAAVAIMAAVLGMANSREALRGTPLSVLREGG
jgi:putative ABC transport system permease protein